MISVIDSLSRLASGKSRPLTAEERKRFPYHGPEAVVVHEDADAVTIADFPKLALTQHRNDLSEWGWVGSSVGWKEL